MTHTLAGLESHGLIQMRPNPDDGRSKCVWLTEKGRQFRFDAMERLQPAMEQMERRFPIERVAELILHLAAIRKYLDDHRDS